jgi:hypothetical protein
MMTTQLTDEAFLEHCTSYISNGRVTPELLTRLFQMVGDGDAAAIWAVVPAQLITGCRTQVEVLIQKARLSLLPDGPKRTGLEAEFPAEVATEKEFW